MVRIKRGVISLKQRKNILKQTKGYRWSRKSKERAAREALLHAYTHSFHDRKKKKGNFRRLWNIKINAGARNHGISYSHFMSLLKKSGVRLDRKILADLAENNPSIFDAVVKESKETT